MPCDFDLLSVNVTSGSYEMVNASATGSFGTDCYEGLLGYAFKYSLPPRSGNGKRITDIYPSTSMNRYKEDEIDSRAYEINTGWTNWMNPTELTPTSYSYQDQSVLYPYLLMDAVTTGLALNWATVRNISPQVREIGSVVLE
jgi:iron complex outermembrane receptor protein